MRPGWRTPLTKYVKPEQPGQYSLRRHAFLGPHSHACAQDWLRNTEAVEEVQIMGEIPQQLRKSIALQVEPVPAVASSPLGKHAAGGQSVIASVVSWPYIAAGLLANGLVLWRLDGGLLVPQVIPQPDACVSASLRGWPCWRLSCTAQQSGKGQGHQSRPPGPLSLQILATAAGPAPRASSASLGNGLGARHRVWGFKSCRVQAMPAQCGHVL